MVNSETANTTHIVFFDNLRMLMVLGVVAAHSAAAYTFIVPGWYVTTHTKSVFCDLVMAVFEACTMPVLFFIAGYFGLPSLRRYGPIAFMGSKLRHLGIPLIALTLFYCPAISYLNYLDKGGKGTFLDFWLKLLPSACDWKFLNLANLHRSSNLFFRFEPFHLWFLSVLLLFCGLLATAYPMLGRRMTEQTRNARAGFGLFCILALVVGVTEAAAQLIVSDADWVAFGPFFAFQTARLPMYLGFFLLGSYAWKRSWVTHFPVPGETWMWSLLAIASFAVYAACGMANLAPGVKPFFLPAAWGLSRTLFGVAATGFLVVFGQRYWNRPGGVSASLAAASYDIYLAHYAPVVLLQYLLVHAALPVFVKFALEFLASLVLCWGASHLAGRHRWFWFPAGAAAFGVCLLIWR